MDANLLKLLSEVCIRFGGFRRFDHISLETVLKAYNRKRAGQFPAVPQYVAAHEMGHALVAIDRGIRVKYATIDLQRNEAIEGPQVAFERGAHGDMDLVYAAGVAGLMFAINLDNENTGQDWFQSLYENAQWGSESDFEQYLDDKGFRRGAGAESYFAVSVMECLRIIGENEGFFCRGRESLSINKFHCGYNLVKLRDGEPINIDYDRVSLREARYTQRFRYVWTSIDRPGHGFMD